MTSEKCFISTNILKGCNLTQHGSKIQIEMFMLGFTLGKNLSLLKGCNWTKHGFKGQTKMFMVRFTLGRNLSLI